MGVEELDDTIRLLRRGSNADLKEKCLRQEWEECLEEEKGMVMRYAHDDSFWREVKEMAQREMQLEVCIMGEQQFRKMFRDFDADGSGSIDVGELKVLLQDALNLTCTDDEVREMMRTVDADGSGEIDEDEFIEIMNAARKQQVESGRIGREPSPRRPSRVPKPQSRSPVQPQQQGYSRPAQIELDLQPLADIQSVDTPSTQPAGTPSVAAVSVTMGVRLGNSAATSIRTDDAAASSGERQLPADGPPAAAPTAVAEPVAVPPRKPATPPAAPRPPPLQTAGIPELEAGAEEGGGRDSPVSPRLTAAEYRQLLRVSSARAGRRDSDGSAGMVSPTKFRTLLTESRARRGSES
eukprot:TRINITY_DN20701_c0_g1_i1.p1 TRINITY_DN20701_c0_g1~~TRINITY_DN20701_c0_g1_i1.p1  ORF type:complete len:380 (+),score=115.18 TRINITY_DN20701_c0_g1_i1:87-1142(+)